MRRKIAAILALALSLQGCALIAHGTRQRVRVFAPDGEAVEVDGETVRPGALELERDRDHVVTFRGERVDVRSHPSRNNELIIPGFVVFVFFVPLYAAGALVFYGIDHASGAAYYLDPTLIEFQR